MEQLKTLPDLKFSRDIKDNYKALHPLSVSNGCPRMEGIQKVALFLEIVHCKALVSVFSANSKWRKLIIKTVLENLLKSDAQLTKFKHGKYEKWSSCNKV